VRDEEKKEKGKNGDFPVRGGRDLLLGTPVLAFKEKRERPCGALGKGSGLSPGRLIFKRGEGS